MNNDGYNPKRGSYATTVDAASAEEVQLAYDDATHRGESPTYETRANGEQATGFNSPTGYFVIVRYNPAGPKMPALNLEEEH